MEKILGIDLPQPGAFLGDMLAKQKVLISHYQQIEGLPSYPLDLQQRASQKLFKSFIQRFVEELSEAFEYLEVANSAITENNRLDAQQAIKGYNHEMADAFHFLWEILIFIGMDDYKLDGQIREFANDNTGFSSLYISGNPIRSLLLMAGVANFNNGVTKHKNSPEQFTIFDKVELDENPHLCGASKLSDWLIGEHSKCLWNLVYAFHITANHLKNREWAKTEREVNYAQFEYNLFQALLHFFIYLDLAGFTEKSIYINYCITNQKNLDRINGGY